MSTRQGSPDSSSALSRHSAHHLALFVALLVLLVWAPIPIGSNREWSSALLAFGAMFVLGGWLLSYAWRPVGLPGALHAARFSLLLLVVWAAYPLAQLLALPLPLVSAIGGEVHELYGKLPADPLNGFGYLSLDRGATFSGFLRQCSLVALFSSVLLLVTSTRRLNALMTVIVVVGFAEALYGLVLFFAGDELGLWAPAQADGVVSGTYVNQNHFAGLLELTIPVGFGLLMSRYPKTGVILGTRDLTRLLMDYVLSQRGILLFAILIMSAALILTASRGGIGSLAIGIAIAATVAASKQGLRARELRIGIVAVVLALIAVSWLGTGQFSEKLRTSGLSSNRGDLREISYQIVASSPLMGTGVGTYRWIFPVHKDERFGAYFYEHAHNDFLEVLSEQGVIGFSLLALGVALIFVRMVQAFRIRRDPLMRGALFASIAGCVSLTVHGLVDFNLQIPANAGYFFVLLGIGSIASTMNGRRAARGTDSKKAAQI